MEEQTVRTITGKLKFLEAKNDMLLPIEVLALNSEVNRNNWQYINLREHLNEFADIPLLTAYNMGGNVIGGGHQFDEKINPKTGQPYVSFTAADAERIVGWIGKNSAQLVNIDGVEWVKVTGFLWKWYSYELCEKLANLGSMEVSIETLITKEHMEGDVAVEEEYIVLGITILGDGVMPAVAGANVSVKTLSHLSEIRNAMEERIMKAASYIEDSGKVNEDNSEKNTFTRSVKTLTYFSKKQCSELSKRFEGFGYSVLAAAQNEEDNSINIALLSKSGDTAFYNMNSVDETIAVERIKACEGKIAFGCGDNSFEVNFETATEALNAEKAKAYEERDNAIAEAQKANEALTAAMATVTEMRNRENARRVQSAKSCAVNVLNAYNEFSQNKVSEKVLEAVNADIDAGLYTEKVNENGDWIGENEVAMRVKALCADEAMKVNKAAAEKNRHVYAWEKLDNSDNDDGSIGALLKQMGIE